MKYTLIDVEPYSEAGANPVVGYATFDITDDYETVHRQKISEMNLSDEAAFTARIEAYCNQLAQDLADINQGGNNLDGVDPDIQSAIGAEVLFSSNVSPVTPPILPPAN